MVSKKSAGVSEEAGAGLELANAASGSCERFDVVIVGCGSSGLYTALNLPAEMSVLVLTKTPCAPAIMRTAPKAWTS